MEKISKLLTVIDIELAILLSLTIFYLVTQAKTSSEIYPANNVLGLQVEEKSSILQYVSVCAEEKCLNINREDVYDGAIFNDTSLNIVVLESIYPYFEKEFGGKSFASNSNGSYIYWTNDLIPDLENISERIKYAFENSINKVVVDIKDLPGTNGWYAQKYIEVDNSKKKLYVWKDGKIQKDILLSPAKDGYQVYGVFPIIDKGVSPIAPTGRYMPYWMAFYYSKSQDSWWGLHGLVWWYDENGKTVYESDSNIGVRRSGGCIRMLKEDAKYLYEIFEKGDLILIHE